MYTPPLFAETDLSALHGVISAARSASLVAFDGEGVVVDHLPMLLDPTRGRFGTLVGHLARANPQGRPEADGRAVAAVFLGPDAYVSPSWYATKAETGKVVPTWNYVAVHAHGRLRLFDDPARLLALVTALTERHEAGRAEPWAVADAPTDFIAAQLKGIVGFEIEIERLDGKAKLGQNRSPADRAGVIAGLSSSADAADRATAVAMISRQTTRSD